MDSGEKSKYMRCIAVSYVVVFLFGMFATAVLAENVTRETNTRNSAEDFRSDWRDDIAVYPVNDVEHHFHSAHVNFQKKNMETAADEVRKAAVLLKLEELRAYGEQYKAIMASFLELRKLADDMEIGKIASAKGLEEIFARTHYALARHYYLKSSESWTERDAQNTGQALGAAAAHLKQAMSWTGHKAEGLITTVVEDACLQADHLSAGDNWFVEEVDRILETLGEEIERACSDQKGEKIPGGNRIKIAVAARGRDMQSVVESRFGRAEWFIVIDTGTGAFKPVNNKKNIDAARGAGVQTARSMADLGVEAVIIAGNIGHKASITLKSAGIDVYIGAEGTVQEALNRFKAGALELAQ